MEFSASISHTVLFVVFIIMIIPSITCSLFILYHFIRSQQIRKRLNNHIILILLLINLIQIITDMPLSLILLYTGFVAVQTSTFCLFWPIYNYTICVFNLTFMSYGCIERYFLVFHRVFFKRHLILLHYGPLIVLLIYAPLVYIGLVLIYPCESYFDYSQFVCGGPCYQYELTLGLYDWICNICTPMVVSTIVTTALIIRVVLQKHRLGQRAIWQRNRKMVIQLTVISILYIVTWLPTVVSFVVPLIGPNSSIIQIGFNLFVYFQYIVCIFYPYMSLVGLPEVRTAIKRLVIRTNAVQPIIHIHE